MTWPPRTWVLADERPGHAHQALGVAEALDWPFTTKPIVHGPLAGLPNGMLGSTTLGLSKASRAALTLPWPDLVIAAGRRTAPVARWLKRQCPRSFLVQLMWPGSAKGFDLLVVPEHDDVPDHGSLLRTIGPVHRITPARLAAAAATLAPRLTDLPRPWIACLIGGSSRHVPFAGTDAAALGTAASALARAKGGSLLVTTSRRTGACEDVLARALAAPHLLHRWQAEGDNPYLGILGSADAVVVTGDSASMCTDACALGRPVFLYRLAAGTPTKLARLHQRLEQLGHLRPLGAAWPEVVPPPLHPAAAVAAAIRATLARRNNAISGDPVASAASTP